MSPSRSPEYEPRDSTLQERGLIQEVPEWLRPYAQATKDFCYLEDPRTEEEVPLIFATSERPFSEQALEYIDKDGKKKRRDTIPLPIASLTFTSHIPDMSRYQKFPLRKLQYGSDRNQVYGMSYPQPKNLLFELDIRTKYMNQMWRLEQVIESRLDHGDARLLVDLGALGVIGHRLSMEGPVDNSDLEPGESRERTLRKTWTITVEGWLSKIVEKTPSARRFSISEEDPDTGEVFRTYTLEESEEG